MTTPALKYGGKDYLVSEDREPLALWARLLRRLANWILEKGL